MHPITGNSSLFQQRLQADNIEIAEFIDLELISSISYHWTTANQPLTYTLSGAPTTYYPFPGGTGSGIQESTDLGVSVMDFTIANTGQILQGALLAGDFSLAGLKIGQCFTDTPDLGRLEIYVGKVGDFAFDRHELTGQARNIWKSLNVSWPYYTYQDKCAWRFGSAGCGFNTASITIAVNTINVASSDTLNIMLNSGTLTQSYAPGRFNFGRATITGGLNKGLIRPIRIHTGDLLSLGQTLPNGDFTGLTLSIYPGCQKRLVADCKSLYNNDKNFFGYEKITTIEQAF